MRAKKGQALNANEERSTMEDSDFDEIDVGFSGPPPVRQSDATVDLATKYFPQIVAARQDGWSWWQIAANLEPRKSVGANQIRQASAAVAAKRGVTLPPRGKKKMKAAPRARKPKVETIISQKADASKYATEMAAFAPTRDTFFDIGNS